jgi:hypothetical protein
VQLTTYAYPWDFARLGTRRTLDDIAALGFDGIDLAATYHPIDALSPRGDAAWLYSNPRGAVHFPARGDRYARIQPHTSDPAICAVWPEIAAHASGLGLRVNAWTVTLFQPWILDRHPDCARVLPGGGPSGSGVCPAHDDVREYVARLCADLTDQCAPNTIRLEAPITQAYDFDWLRARVLVTPSPLARALLALCACDACNRRARDVGLDHIRLQRLVNESILTELAAGRDGDPDLAVRLGADAELQTYAAQQARATNELVQATIGHVRGTAGGGATPAFAATLTTPFGPLLGDAEDTVLTELAALVDAVTLMPGNPASAHVTELARAADPAPALDMLVPPVRQPREPGEEPPAFGEARRLGVGELGLYNYGLLRDRDVRNFVDAFRAAFG